MFAGETFKRERADDGFCSFYSPRKCHLASFWLRKQRLQERVLDIAMAAQLLALALGCPAHEKKNLGSYVHGAPYTCSVHEPCAALRRHFVSASPQK